MDKKICIITGGNRGIGRGIAEAIAKKGHNSVIISRNKENGLKIANNLRKKYGDTIADSIQGNLSSIESTKHLANDLLKKFPKTDCLIHNAAIWPSKLILNEDGFEMAYMVNHLAPFYLTHLLLPRLRENKRKF